MRYLDLAIFTVWAAYFTIPIFWLPVHSFPGFWRRHSGRFYAAYAIVIWVAMEAAFWLTRDFWFRDVFARVWWVWLIGAALAAAEPLLVSRVEAVFTMPILVGWAERDPAQFPPRLIDTGIYARIRHPRYIASMAVVLGLSALSGSWRLVELSLLSLPIYWLLTDLEERELAARIGHPFVEYRKRVPRFIPNAF